jgi:hypothetical protein
MGLEYLTELLARLRPTHPHDAIQAYIAARHARLHDAVANAKALGATDEQLAPLMVDADLDTTHAETIAEAILESP